MVWTASVRYYNSKYALSDTVIQNLLYQIQSGFISHLYMYMNVSPLCLKEKKNVFVKKPRKIPN